MKKLLVFPYLIKFFFIWFLDFRVWTCFTSEFGLLIYIYSHGIDHPSGVKHKLSWVIFNTTGEKKGL